MDQEGLKKFEDFDVYKDLLRVRAVSSDFDNKLCEYRRQLEENDEVDEDYKNILFFILTKAERVEPHEEQREKDDNVSEHDKEERGEPHEKQREKADDDCDTKDDFSEHNNDCHTEDDVREHNSDCDTEEENDPQYELFLEHLKAHEKSYALEYEKNGVPVVIKYEGEESSDEECDPEPNLEPRRKLRSAMKQKSGPSSQMPSVENRRKHDLQSTSTKKTKNLTRRKLRNKAKDKKAENVKCSTNEMVPDPDYLAFCQALKIVDDHYVYTYGGQTVVYEMEEGKNNQDKEKHHDESSSDVEIIDSALFYKSKVGSLNPSMMNEDSISNLGGRTIQSEFRHQLIALLRKPFKQEEYDKLWLHIKLRKPEERHLDLRNGRERSYLMNKDGKSYLDHHPDLSRQLSRFEDDKPRRLNLLRGFFFWLQNFVQDGSFRPWNDAECLAINPESC